MFMLLWVERILWSSIGDSGCVVTPVWGPMPAFHASYMSTGNMGTRPVASILCRHRGVLKTMRGTSAAPSTAVPTCNARYCSRRQVGARNERENAIMKEHEFTLILTT